MAVEVIKSILEKRIYDGCNENPILIYLTEYLNNIELYDVLWTGKKERIHIEFLREILMYYMDDEIGCEIRYDGRSALGRGKGITYRIPPDMMKPIERYFKLKNVLNDTNKKY